MRAVYKFGLLLIFLLLISKYCTHAASTNQSSSAIDDYDYKDEYDDDDYYSEITKDVVDDNDAIEKQEKANTRLKTSSVEKEEISASTNNDELVKPKIEIPKRSNHVVEPICPKRCQCLKDYKYIQCTNVDLTQILNDIPSTATHLDLSQNHLSSLEYNDLVNYTKLLEINLSNNQITNISKEVFENNLRLKKINLSGNRLSKISTDTFLPLLDLETLDLSNNSIELPLGISFLNQPRLLELSCRNCSWTQLYDESFENLGSLTALRLDQNDFNKKINTKAFTPLKNLIKLRLPPLDQESVTELCSLLKSIDNISFRHFDVSCYELVLGYSYNESLIQTADPSFQSKILEQTTVSNKNYNNEKATSIKMTELSADGTLLNVTLSHLNETAISGINNSSIATAGILTNDVASDTTSINTDDKTYQVPVSQEIINIMLICIMIIAVIGLAIGLICRKDVGGIKTKCCRTNKAQPKDETAPVEEIPLNKLA